MLLDRSDRQDLFAHCAALSINAVHEPWNRSKERLAHADHLARAVWLDMAAAGWTPTVDTYLGQVPKARILEAVREAKGDGAAQLIDHLKKADMAAEAERLLAGSGWLPEPLRMTDVSAEMERAAPEAEEVGDLPAFLTGRDDLPIEEERGPEDDASHLLAAE